MGSLIKIFALSMVIMYLALIMWLLKSRRLYLKYALLWLLTGAAMAAIIGQPKIISWLFEFCGFRVFSNGLFTVLILFILLILLALTSIASELNDKSRRLVQTAALLEKRIRDLEGNIEKNCNK